MALVAELPNPAAESAVSAIEWHAYLRKGASEETQSYSEAEDRLAQDEDTSKQIAIARAQSM